MPSKKITAERLEFLRKQIGIPDDMSNRAFPFYELNGVGNIFGDIAIAVRAWKKVDAKIANRIMPVINENCKSPEEVDAFLNDIAGIEDWNHRC